MQTDDEFKKSLNTMAGGDGDQTSDDGTPTRSMLSVDQQFDNTRQVLPDYVNWVESGAVTAAKDQVCLCFINSSVFMSVGF